MGIPVKAIPLTLRQQRSCYHDLRTACSRIKTKITDTHPTSEASCHIRIDYMIQATKLAYLDRHPLEQPEAETASGRSIPPTSCPRPLMVCPEMDMCVIVTDKRDPEKERKVKNHREDRLAYIHGARAESGQNSILIAVGAKNPGAISQARY